MIGKPCHNVLCGLWKKIFKYRYIFLLLAVAISSHLIWFYFGTILNNKDWGFIFDEAVDQYFSSYGTWVNFCNFGKVNIQLYSNLFYSVWSLFTNVGLSFDTAVKISFLIPIAIIGFLAPYILFENLTKNKLISFFVSLFYGTTTYFLLRQTAHLPIALVYAATPLVVYFFIKALKNNKFINWITFILIYWISGCFEIRITYIITFILFLYIVFFSFSDIKKIWKNISAIILIFIGLNIFWLLPTLFSGSVDSISVVANRGLFGNFLFDLQHSFTLYESSWTGDLPNSQFVKQSIIWYFWLVPIIAFSVFLFKNNYKYKKEVVFFGAISLIGIFLTKQAAEPLPNTYLWLYNNFPGFNLFREASKFYLLTAFGYAGLIGYGLMTLKGHKNNIINKYILSAFSVFLIGISLFNIKPLINGEIRTMFVSRHIPNGYIVLKDFVLDQTEYFRTFWTPRDSRWGIYIDQKPRISNAVVIGDGWKSLVENINKNEKLIQNQIINVFEFNFANNLFDVSSIKYIIVPIQDIENDDDFFVSYGGEDNPKIREWYISELNKVDWLNKIDIETQDLVVYENENYRPHIYVTKEEETIRWEVPFERVDFVQKNPTEYKISLKNLNKKTYLNFSESFHPDWKLRVGDFDWFSVLIQKDYFLPDEFHLKNNANLSTFKIDPEFIKENYPNSYTENPDGSIDVEMVLYFKPQSYFYLGLIISGTTLIGCLGFLLYDWRKRRKLIKKEQGISTP